MKVQLALTITGPCPLMPERAPMASNQEMRACSM
jgi:hypothetical protein